MIKFVFLGLIALFQLIKSELIFVQELFRHGARGTIVKSTWDSDQHPELKEELTSTGIRQHYTLGQALRKEYVDELDFMDGELNWDQLRVTCTDFNRTLQSAYSQLYGFYPPGTGYSMNDLVSDEDMLPPFQGAQQPQGLDGLEALPNLYQPIPVHVNVSVLAWPPDFCPEFVNIKNNYAKVQNKDVYDSINQNYNETFRSFESLIDYDGELNFSNIEDVWDVMVSDLNNGFPLPQGLTAQLWQNLTELDTLEWFFIENGSPTAVKIQNTALFLAWIENFETKLANKDWSRKWMMYSAHDNNVASAMVGLGLASWQCSLSQFWNNTSDGSSNCNQRPYFASSLVLELHINDESNEPEVMVKFDGTYQNICGQNSTVCAFDLFKQNLLANTLDGQQMWKACDGEELYDNYNYQKQDERKKNVIFGQQQQSQQGEIISWEILNGVLIFGVVVLIALIYRMRMRVQRLKEQRKFGNTQVEYNQV